MLHFDTLTVGRRRGRRWYAHWCRLHQVLSRARGRTLGLRGAEGRRWGGCGRPAREAEQRQDPGVERRGCGPWLQLALLVPLPRWRASQAGT